MGDGRMARKAVFLGDGIYMRAALVFMWVGDLQCELRCKIASSAPSISLCVSL